MMSTAELRERRAKRAAAYRLGWNDSFRGIKSNPFHAKRDESEHNQYERGFADAQTKGLAPIPEPYSRKSEVA